jgi:hypothetical protein
MQSEYSCILLDMAPGSTVKDIMQQLRRQHKIADLSRIKHHIVFPAHRFASLALTDKLKDVGIRDLSVLHLRTSTLGGSSRTSGQLFTINLNEYLLS